MKVKPTLKQFIFSWQVAISRKYYVEIALLSTFMKICHLGVKFRLILEDLIFLV